jgi:signal peptidase II
MTSLFFLSNPTSAPRPTTGSPLSQIWKKAKTLAVVAGSLIVLDQALKASMRQLVPKGSFRILTSFFDLVHAWNPGISFGLLACRTSMQRLLLTVLTGLIIASLTAAYVKARLPHQRIGLCLIISGAASNMIDRIAHGAVFDFISLHWGRWAFPAFNLADMLVSIGFLTLMCENFQWKALRFSKKTP